MIPILIILTQAQNAATKTYILEQDLDGFTGYTDTSIFSENENAAGGDTGVFTGTNQQLRHRRALIRIDLSAIPQNATVLNAEFQMQVERSGENFGDFDLSLHRLTATWGEGTIVGPLMGGFGAPAAPGDATWPSNHHATSMWTTPGADYASTPSATAPAGQQGAIVLWNAPGLTADLQTWIATPTTNNGWVIISEIEGQQQRAKRLHSSEAPQFRPRLTLTVDIPLGPPESLPLNSSIVPTLAIALLSLGLADMAYRNRKRSA